MNHEPPISNESVQIPENILIECLLNFCSRPDIKQSKCETLQELFSTKCISDILSQISTTYFNVRDPHNEILDSLTIYFHHIFGFYIKPVIDEGSSQKISMVVLYACVYSGQKQKFVEKIMEMDLKVQEMFVRGFEDIESEMKGTGDQDKVMEMIWKLEGENLELKNALKEAKEAEEIYEMEIKKLKEELEETKNERNTFISEKKEMLSKFKISSLADYEDLCLELVHQNKQHIKKESELMGTIRELEDEIKIFKKGMKRTDEVLIELNFRNSVLIKDHEQLAREIENYQESVFYNTKQIEKNDREDHSDKEDNDEKENYKDKGLEETRFSTRASSILKTEVLTCTNGSGFSEKSRRESRTSAWNVFQTTKDNVLLNEKNQRYEEEIEQLKLKLLELEVEIGKFEDKEKFYEKRNRKIEKLADDFAYEFACICGTSAD